MTTKNTYSGKYVLFLFYIMLSLLRLPEIISQNGRFLFEDGTTFFSYAWKFSSIPALFRPFGGYLNFVTNASSLLSARLVQHHFISLAGAPAINCFVALLFQLFPAYLIIWDRVPWLRTTPVKIGALLSIVCASMSEESWLNIMHAQLWLTLSCALLLTSRFPRVWYGWLLDAVVLLAAPLSGMSAVILCPLFLLKSIKESSGRRFIQTLLIGFAACVQVFFFYSSTSIRHSVHDFSVILNLIFLRMDLIPFLGALSKTVGKGFTYLYKERSHGVLLPWLLLTFCSAFVNATILFFCWKKRYTNFFYLFIAGISIAALSFYGGMTLSDPLNEFFQPKFGEHYNFLPVTLFTLSLLALADTISDEMLFKRITYIYGWTILVAALSFSNHFHLYNAGQPWRQEAELWEKDHSYEPKTWLNSGIDLSPQQTRCPPYTEQNISLSAPKYCEVFWSALVKQK